MARATRKGSADALAATIMFQAPLVIWMRVPLLFMEMARPWAPGSRRESERAAIEKLAAGMEAAGKLQIELAGLWTETVLGMLSGTWMAGTGNASRAEKYRATAIEPYARRVRGNASRLKRRAVRR